MNVKELIRELKRLPEDLKVGVAMHDNSEGEVAGWAFSVDVVIEKVQGKKYHDYELGDECVVIHC